MERRNTLAARLGHYSVHGTKWGASLSLLILVMASCVAGQGVPGAEESAGWPNAPWDGARELFAARRPFAPLVGLGFAGDELCVLDERGLLFHETAMKGVPLRPGSLVAFGRHTVVIDEEGEVSVREPDGKSVSFSLGSSRFLTAVATLDDLLAVGDDEGRMTLHSLKSGDELRELHCEHAVSAVAFADQRTLIVGDDQGGVAAFDVDDGRRRYRVLEGTSGVRVVTTQGAWVATGESDGAVSVRTWRDGSLVWRSPAHRGWVTALAFSPDGTRLASGGVDGVIAIREVTAPTLAYELPPRGAVSGLCFRDNDRLVIAHPTGHVFDEAVPRSKSPRVDRGHRLDVLGVAFHPNGALIASGSMDGSVRLLDAETGRTVRVIAAHGDSVVDVEFTPDGSQLVTASADHTVGVFATETGLELRRLLGHEGRVACVAVSPDGAWFVSGAADHTVRVWDATTGTCVKTLSAHAESLKSVTFSPDGLRLITGGADGRINVFAVSEWTLTRSMESNVEGLGVMAHVHGLRVHPNNRLLLSGHLDGALRLWDLETGALLHLLRGHEASVEAVDWNGDGSLMVSCSGDRTVRLWDTRTTQAISVLKGHGLTVVSTRFDPSGTRIVSGSSDHTVRVWDVATGRTLVTSPLNAGRGNGLVVVGDQVLAAHEDGGVRSFAATTGQPLGHVDATVGPARALAVLDDDHVVVGGEDGSVSILAVAPLRFVAELLPAERPVRALAVDATGERIAIGTADGVVRILTRATASVVRSAGDDAIVALAWSKEGQLFAGTGRGVITIDRDLGTRQKIDGSPSGIRHLLATDTGVLVSHLRGVARFEGAWKHLDVVGEGIGAAGVSEGLVLAFRDGRVLGLGEERTPVSVATDRVTAMTVSSKRVVLALEEGGLEFRRRSDLALTEHVTVFANGHWMVRREGRFFASTTDGLLDFEPPVEEAPNLAVEPLDHPVLIDGDAMTSFRVKVRNVGTRSAHGVRIVPMARAQGVASCGSETLPCLLPGGEAILSLRAGILPLADPTAAPAPQVALSYAVLARGVRLPLTVTLPRQVAYPVIADASVHRKGHGGAEAEHLHVTLVNAGNGALEAFTVRLSVLNADGVLLEGFPLDLTSEDVPPSERVTFGRAISLPEGATKLTIQVEIQSENWPSLRWKRSVSVDVS